MTTIKRPEHITNDDLLRWDEVLDQDKLTPKYMKDTALIREIFYAGFWLLEKLGELGCSEEKMLRVQYTHGSMSFGRDGWSVAEELLADYKAGTMDFVDEAAIEKEIEAIKTTDIPRDIKTQN